MDKRLLSFVVDKEAQQLFIHLDFEGVNILVRSMERLRNNLQKNECEHEHLFSVDWGGWELSTSMPLKSEDGEKPIHHVKIYGWNDEEADKNGFDRTIKEFEPETRVPDGSPTEEQQARIDNLTDEHVRIIDEAILASLSTRWLKVARIVGGAMAATSKKVPNVPDIFYSERVRHLAALGKLEAQGDLNYMRFSEIRLPS